MKTQTYRATELFTIGHSNRSLEDFLSLLKEFDVKTLADIRRFPNSRKFPHFNREELSQWLITEGIHYAWFEPLGGLRQSVGLEKSPNMGLETLGFRNYADYMMTDEFRKAVQELIVLCEESSTAMMCAEKFYWKCHRRLLSDFLTARGVLVKHILGHGDLKIHQLTPGAVVSEEGITYPKKPARPEQGFLFSKP
jgi:uncharacterized protein (DUF488 family)